jgi:hypothetical protein
MTKAGNSQIIRTITLLITIFSLSLPTYAEYSGGAGEPNDPYQIATAEDLMLMGDSPEDYDKHFILTADIDLDPNLPGRKVFDRAVIAPDMNDVNSGFQGAAFTGLFDGNSHTISHMTIEGGGYLGLFGQTGYVARISNLDLEGVDVKGTGDDVGGLAGFNWGYITSCYSTGSVSVNENHDGGGTVGGVGGLVGRNYFAGITMSYSTVAVTGNNEAGGLAGINHGTVSNCYSTGSVTGEGTFSSVGGLVGDNSGNITNGYSTGSVTGESSVGGLVGFNRGSITACYSTGVVTGAGGGLVGRNWRGSITLSFWDMETSGQATSSGGMGLTMTEMQDINTYLSEGWDFVDEILNCTCDYWQISSGEYPRLHWQNNKNLQMPEGLGTAEQPYLIRDIRDLGTVWFKPLAHYRLETSMDLSETMWSMAVVPWFDGTFDGNNHVISNLHIQGGGFLGLFGQLGPSARISRLGLEAVDINGAGNDVGGLVGYIDTGSITNSYSTGSVTGQEQVGGLVGWNRHGIISESYNTGTVTGESSVGGLVGCNETGSITTSYSNATVTGTVLWIGGLVGNSENEGDVIACYSIGTVTGNRCVGGLVGILEGSITSSYSTGRVTGNENVGGLLGSYDGGTVANSYSTGTVSGTGSTVGGLVGGGRGGIANASFWDMETSGQITSSGGVGKTTAEMQTASTFLEAGWDFVDETENGTEGIWKIIEGQTYPLLSWQKYGGGTGEPNDPYLIYTAEHLNALGAEPNDYNNHFKLMADINLSGYSYDRAVIAPDTNDVENWYQGIPFTGVFDGNGHTISHFAIEGGGRLGLFGRLDSGANISNLGLEAVDVNGTGDFVGGLVGVNSGGSIEMCYSTGTVSGFEVVGGLAGLGGSYNTTISGSITSSYSTATVNGIQEVGGLAGVSGVITACYSTGTVNGGRGTGGLVGISNASITSSFWDIQTSGCTNMCGIQEQGVTGCDDSFGLTTFEMQVASTFLDAGWDFVNENENGTDDIWWILEGQDYPRLWWEAEGN